jgi:hypothetical protein
MERNTYRQINQAQVLLQAFPEAQSGDAPVVTIYDVDDAATDVNQTAMTAVSGVTWKYAWTPTEAHNYLITYTNPQQDNVSHYEYVKVSGEIAGVPGGAGIGSTLAVLLKAFLIQLDNYSATDAASGGDGSSRDLGIKCLNKALQKIYSTVKDSKFMEAYPSTALVSVSGTDYIALSGITDLDDILNLMDTTYFYKLTRIPFWRYRLLAPDPSVITGIPTHYARLFNRIYLYPRPSAAITYTTDYVKTYAELSADADVALLPSKYNYWIYAEAEVEWYKMQDPYNIPQIVLTERQRCEELATKDIYSGFNENYVSDSIFGRQEIRRRSNYTIE